MERCYLHLWWYFWERNVMEVKKFAFNKELFIHESSWESTKVATSSKLPVRTTFRWEVFDPESFDLFWSIYLAIPSSRLSSSFSAENDNCATFAIYDKSLHNLWHPPGRHHHNDCNQHQVSSFSISVISVFCKIIKTVTRIVLIFGKVWVICCNSVDLFVLVCFYLLCFYFLCFAK